MNLHPKQVLFLAQFRSVLMKFISTIAFASLLCAATAASAQTPQLIAYSSGTGFFVTHDGHVLTNNHVIEKCDQISIQGDRMSTGVTLVAVDREHDLALLKGAFTSPEMAYFNSQKQPLNAGDPVVIIGYPGDSWRGHNPVMRTSTIIDTKGPTGEDKWLQFQESVEHGNSGGPLLDSTGNVVGVVVAKVELQLVNTRNPTDIITKKSDVAISLQMVKNFLQRNNVQYQTRDSGIYLSPDRVSDRTRPFIVNVNCRKVR